jgi:hypothetical protein
MFFTVNAFLFESSIGFLYILNGLIGIFNITFILKDYFYFFIWIFPLINLVFYLIWRFSTSCKQKKFNQIHLISTYIEFLKVFLSCFLLNTSGNSLDFLYEGYSKFKDRVFFSSL